MITYEFVGLLGMCIFAFIGGITSEVKSLRGFGLFWKSFSALCFFISGAIFMYFLVNGGFIQ